jgi:hypothetical protein
MKKLIIEDLQGELQIGEKSLGRKLLGQKTK